MMREGGVAAMEGSTESKFVSRAAGIESNLVSRAGGIEKNLVSKVVSWRAVEEDGKDMLRPMDEAWVEGGWKESEPVPDLDTRRSLVSPPGQRENGGRGPKLMLFQLLSCCIILADCVSIGTRSVDSYRNGSNARFSEENLRKWTENGHLIWDVIVTVLLTAEAYTRSRFENHDRKEGGESLDVESALLKLDKYVAVSSWVGVVLSFSTISFTLRPLRLFRVVYQVLQVPGRKPVLNGIETMVISGKDCFAGIGMLVAMIVASGSIALHVLLSSVDGRCGASSEVGMIPLTRCSTVDPANSTCPQPFQCFEFSDRQDHYRNIFGVGLLLFQGVANDGMDVQLHRTEQAVPELLSFSAPFFVCFFLLANYILANFVRSSVLHAYSRVIYKTNHLQEIPSCWLMPFEQQSAKPVESEEDDSEVYAGVQKVQISLQRFALRTINSVGFSIFSDSTIIVYVCLQVARHERMSGDQQAGFDWAEGVLVVWFLLENILVAYAYGVTEHWMDNAWRVIDALLTFISFASICAISSGSQSHAFKATGTAVSLRVFKVLIRYPLLKLVAGRIVRALEGLLGGLAVAVTALVSFALMARILMGDAMEQEGSMEEGASRFSFRTVFWAGLSLLRLLAPDHVSLFLLEASQAAQRIGGLACSIAVVVLLLLWLVIGYLLLASLLVAPIVHAFRVPITEPATARKALQKLASSVKERAKAILEARKANADAHYNKIHPQTPARCETESRECSKSPPVSPRRLGNSPSSPRRHRDSPTRSPRDAKSPTTSPRHGSPTPRHAWPAESPRGRSAGGVDGMREGTRGSGRGSSGGGAVSKRGSQRDGSRVLKLARTETGLSPRNNRGSGRLHLGRQDSVGTVVVPHPKDREKFGDAIVEFDAGVIEEERPESAMTMSTVNTGAGWGTRSFLMDGMEMDQTWIDDISRPTTAAGENDMDHIEIGDAASKPSSAEEATSKPGSASPQRSDQKRSPIARRSPHSPSRSPSSPSRSGAHGHDATQMASPAPQSPVPASDQHTPVEAQASPGLSEPEERGKCFHCLQPVLDSQPRYKDPDGRGYCHSICQDRPPKPESDDIADGAAQLRPIRKVKNPPSDRDGLNLHRAVRQKDWDFLHHLIVKGAPLDAQNPKTGQTALHLACELRRLEAVSALVEGGANVEIEDHARRTPVMVAARAGFLEPIRLMVTKTRVDLYHKDKDNKMAVQLVPLHSPFTRLALETMCGWELLAAARKGKLQKVTTLLENGASTWLSDTQNRTALHLAAENGRLTVVQRLVEFRAHLDAEDVHNKTPLELAARRHHKDVVSLLTEAGARVENETDDGEYVPSFAKSAKVFMTRFQELRKHPRKVLRRLCGSWQWKLFAIANSILGFLPAALYTLPHQSQYAASNDIPNGAQALAHSSTALLGLEIILKVSAYGWTTRSESLFRRWLDSIDFVILVIAIVHPSFAVACSAKAVRLIRVVPVLGMRQDSEIMINGVSQCLWPLLGTGVLVGALYVSFAIAESGLLGGLLTSCSDRAIVYPHGRIDCVGYSDVTWNFLAPRSWESSATSVDDFPSALETVFVASSMEWSGMLTESVDVTQEGRQSQVQTRTAGAVFCSMLIFVVGVVATGCIGAIAANSVRGYREGIPDPAGAYVLLVLRIQSYASRLTIGGRGSKSSQALLEPYGVRFFFEGISVLNIILIASFHENASSAFETLYWIQNHVCSVLLAVEVLLYISAYGLVKTLQIRKHWCSLLALAGAGIDFMGVKETIVIRVVARTLRLVLWFSELGRDGVKSLSVATTAVRLALSRTLPPLGTLVVIIAIYAAVGHQAFAFVKPGDALTSGLNFENFPRSAWLMFHVLAGSQWHLLMADCAVSSPSCTQDSIRGDRGDCGDSGFATLFFMSFKVLVVVVGGLLLGSILDCVDRARHVEDDTIGIQHLVRVRQEWVWMEGWVQRGVKVDQAASLIQLLPPPLGMSEEESETRESGRTSKLPHSELFKQSGAAEQSPPRQSKQLRVAADPKGARVEETITMLGITAALRNKGRLTRVFPSLQHLFPDGRRTPITQLRQVGVVEYEDFVLTLIHLAAPHLIPRALRPLHDAILEHTAKVQASREIIHWIRRRWEWRRNWADLLNHVHEQAQKTRLRDKLQRDREEEERRRERERREEELRLQRRRELEELYDMQGWVTRTCNINLHTSMSRQQLHELQFRGYFARCIYYELHIPFGCPTGSPLTPSVNEPIPGYPFHQRSASTFRTVAIPAVPPIPSIPPRKNYTATELCDVLNSLIANDLQCYLDANDRRHTLGLEEAWEEMRKTLFHFDVDGAESNGFRLRMHWPGDVLGPGGLAAVNSDPDEIRRANVRVYCAQHSFYAMAVNKEDRLYPPVGNLAMYLGFFKGNKKHWSPVLGNQNSIVLGGSNKVMDIAVPGGPLSSHTLEHCEDVLSLRDFDDEPAKTRRRGELIWAYGSRQAQMPSACEAQRLFLMNYSGGFGKKRAEVLALQILQATMRAKLARLGLTTQKVQGRKLGEKGMNRVLVSQFLGKRERRQASLAYMLKKEQSASQSLQLQSTMKL